MGPSEPSAEEQGAGRGHSSAVWDPEVYLRYADERARPFNELVARVGAESPRTVVDLGVRGGSADRARVLRPVLTTLDEQDAAALTEEYAAGLRAAYPRRPDGATAVPYRRVFAVGSRH
jgi:trans-aconitate methyltransferase